MLKYLYCLTAFSLFSCQQASENPNTAVSNDSTIKALDKIAIFQKEHANTSTSKSLGSVGKGSLENAWLLPFKGNNFEFFSKQSYLFGRAFTHSTVYEILLHTFEDLEQSAPHQLFYIMEASHEKGGKIDPHRTHQNGTSIDLMVPLLKNNMPYTGLDTLGFNHYLLDFDSDGKYLKDTSVCINFELLALEIWTIQKQSKLHNSKISKVILKTELYDNIMKTSFGPQLVKEKIYFTRHLEKVINDLHDDHIHVDFDLN